jgi:hypothetical protein
MTRTIVNQEPSAIKDKSVIPIFLPRLLALVTAVEQFTGYQWNVTSYIRKSPSHEKGYAIDIAPSIAPKSRHLYAVYRRSDPVLYKRTKLIRQLQQLCRHYVDPSFDIGIYIEPDHLHMQLFAPSSGRPQTRLFKWRLIKPIYPDSSRRSELPMMNTNS